MGETIAKFDKNSIEVVVITLNEWKKELYFDIRIWLKGDPGHDGAEQATKKGICLNVELLPDLRRALDELERRLEKGEDAGAGEE
jgi:hypothetical protein